jgi:hypothetical protein
MGVVVGGINKVASLLYVVIHNLIRLLLGGGGSEIHGAKGDLGNRKTVGK